METRVTYPTWNILQAAFSFMCQGQKSALAFLVSSSLPLALRCFRRIFPCQVSGQPEHQDDADGHDEEVE